jgi:hypothetical protein
MKMIASNNRSKLSRTTPIRWFRDRKNSKVGLKSAVSITLSLKNSLRSLRKVRF